VGVTVGVGEDVGSTAAVGEGVLVSVGSGMSVGVCVGALVGARVGVLVGSGSGVAVDVAALVLVASDREAAATGVGVLVSAAATAAGPVAVGDSWTVSVPGVRCSSR
jgi:hypothetical protein